MKSSYNPDSRIVKLRGIELEAEKEAKLCIEHYKKVEFLNIARDAKLERLKLELKGDTQDA